MANLRLDLDTRTKKNGMCPIRLRINSAGTSAYVATGVSVEEQYFIDGSLYDCIHRKAPMAVEKRDKVARLVRQFEEFMTDMDETELARMTARDIKERVYVHMCRRRKQQLHQRTSWRSLTSSARVGTHRRR